MQSALTGMAIQHLMGGGGSQKSSGLGSILQAVMGGKAKQQRQVQQRQQQAHQNGMGIIGKMLDADGDGSIMDDVLRMAMNKR